MILSAIPEAIEEPYGGTTEVEYGLIRWEKVRGLYLRVLITLLLCLAIYQAWVNYNPDDYNERDNKVTVSNSTFSEITVTATPNYE